MGLRDLVGCFASPFQRAPDVVSGPRAELFLPAGYRSNPPQYFEDAPTSFTYQPHVYALARFLAQRAGLRHIIDLGSGNGQKLIPLARDFDVISVDVGSNLARVAQAVPAARCIEFDLQRGLPPLPENTWRAGVVILADVLEHLGDPVPLLRGLKAISHLCPYVLLSTPDRDRARGPADLGPPANPAHVREWNLSEFTRLLASVGLGSEFVGFTINTDFHRWKSTLLALLGSEVAFARSASVRGCAIVHAYNEADVIEECLRHLVGQGLDVILVDNWSTDDTYERALDFGRSTAKLMVHRFPDRPTAQYEWHLQLLETVRIAESSGHDWIVHNDADEFRYSPWSGVTLNDALGFVSALGYSALDFTVLDFRYLDSQPMRSSSVRDDLLFFDFGRRPGHFLQVKAWRNQPPGSVDLASSGGHEARFEGRRIFPLKFLLRHYPLRSEAQARQKVLRDRLPRSMKERQERGWHSQYQGVDEVQLKGWRPEALLPFNPATFATDYLVERISGIGLEPPS